jgi:hypothetical protein
MTGISNGGLRPARTARRLALALALGGLVVVTVPAYARPAAAARTALAAPTPISLNKANWSGSAGYASRRPSWYQDGSDVIHLQGAVRQISSKGANAGLIGTLPARARPAADVYTIVHTFNGTYADLVIQTTGHIFVIGPRSPAVQDLSFLSLESITYRRSGATIPFSLNKKNWSGSAGYDSRYPAWYQDASGVIHLQGAVRQINGPALTSQILGTLPAGIRPAATLLFMVHSFNGTYAQVAIDTNGQVLVIPPVPPAVQDFSFVSLEGVSYRPGNQASPIPLNTKQWVGLTEFGTRAPAWYADRSGLIHLEGAVSATTRIDDYAVIGTLPPKARPTADVYTIVPTNPETYTDLVIQTNGDIVLITPRPPAPVGNSVVFLEGITYRR